MLRDKLIQGLANPQQGGGRQAQVVDYQDDSSARHGRPQRRILRPRGSGQQKKRGASDHSSATIDFLTAPRSHASRGAKRRRRTFPYIKHGQKMELCENIGSGPDPPQLREALGRLSIMEPATHWLSRGFHAVADVTIATATGVIAVPVCYPIYIVTAVVKIPLKRINRVHERDDTVEQWADVTRPEGEIAVNQEMRVH